MSQVSATPVTTTGNYTIDPVHSRIGFSVRHMMVSKVRGQFSEYTGTGYFDADDPAKSHAELVIKAASIDTRNPDRDNHLRSNDFLDMEHYPEITFKTTEVKKVDESHFSVTGDLTIRGTSRPVTIGFEGSTTINRRDWGVNWNAALEAGGVVVSDNVTLEVEVEAIKND